MFTKNIHNSRLFVDVRKNVDFKINPFIFSFIYIVSSRNCGCNEDISVVQKSITSIYLKLSLENRNKYVKLEKSVPKFF